MEAEEIGGHGLDVGDHRSLGIQEATQLADFQVRQGFHGIHDIADFTEGMAPLLERAPPRHAV
jgi:hypothetical protein